MPEWTVTLNDCKKMLVTKAIFPVAGLGTRFLPATKAQPKEMLPVVDKPLIQYAVEEAYAAGVREMIFVTGRHKRPIEDHFDMTFELEVALEQAGKQELLDVVRTVKPDDMECIYVRQSAYCSTICFRMGVSPTIRSSASSTANGLLPISRCAHSTAWPSPSAWAWRT